MRSFFQLTGKEKTIELLRWVCVLPVAMLGGFGAFCIAGVVKSFGSFGGIVNILITQFPIGTAIVLAGAITAPRFRLATACCLAVPWVLVSYIIHVQQQRAHGAVPEYFPGVIAALATAAAVVYIFLKARKS